MAKDIKDRWAKELRLKPFKFVKKSKSKPKPDGVKK